MQGNQAQETTLNKRISSLYNAKETILQRLSVRFVVWGPLARIMSLTVPYRHFVDQQITRALAAPKRNLARSEQLDTFRPTDSGLHPSKAFSVQSWHRSGKIHVSLPLFLSTSSSYAWAPRLYDPTTCRRDVGKPAEQKDEDRERGVVPKYNCFLQAAPSVFFLVQPTAPSNVNSCEDVISLFRPTKETPFCGPNFR